MDERGLELVERAERAMVYLELRRQTLAALVEALELHRRMLLSSEALPRPPRTDGDKQEGGRDG